MAYACDHAMACLGTMPEMLTRQPVWLYNDAFPRWQKATRPNTQKPHRRLDPASRRRLFIGQFGNAESGKKP
jgi:hypothetical protein